MNWRLLTYQVRFIIRSQRDADRRRMQADAEATAASTYKHLLRESADLLRLAVQQNGPIQTAARNYAALLSQLAAGRDASGRKAA